MRFCATIVIASFKRNDFYFQLAFFSRGHFGYVSCHDAMFALCNLQQLNPHGLLDIRHLIALFCVRMNYMLLFGDSQGLTILHFIIRSTQSFARVRHLSSRLETFWHIVLSKLTKCCHKSRSPRIELSAQ